MTKERAEKYEKFVRIAAHCQKRYAETRDDQYLKFAKIAAIKATLAMQGRG